MTIDASAESYESSADYGLYEFEQFEIDTKQTDQDRRVHAMWKRLRFSLCSMNADGSAGAPEAPDRRETRSSTDDEWHGDYNFHMRGRSKENQASVGASVRAHKDDWFIEGRGDIDNKGDVSGEITLRNKF